VPEGAFHHVYAVSRCDFFPSLGHFLVGLSGFDHLRSHLREDKDGERAVKRLERNGRRKLIKEEILDEWCMVSKFAR